MDPIIANLETIEALENNIIAFYTGHTRKAPELLRLQSEALSRDKSKQDVMKRMVMLCYQIRDDIQKNNLDSFGETLHESWELKRSLSDGISNMEVDEIYSQARRAGALGGKLLGAGAGGFMIFYARREDHEKIAKSLSSLKKIKFRFEKEGSKIILIH